MEERRMTVYKGQGAVAISFDATRYGINLSTELDYLVSVWLNATAPLIITKGIQREYVSKLTQKDIPYSISESFSQSSYNRSNSAVTSSFCFTSS